MKVTKDSNDIYHSHDSISASGLKTIHKKSVYHLINQQFKETPAMALGTAVHQAILEPHDFHDIYHVIEKIDKRTKAGKEEYQKQIDLAKGKIIIEDDIHEIIKSILGDFRQNDLAQKYCKGEIELSHYTQYEGIDVRVRPDVINHVSDFITDVKTCQDNSPQAFKRDVYNWGYHLQAAFYMDMCGINNFRFIACTTKYPYTVEVYTLDEKDIEFGRMAYKNAFKQWKKYLETGVVSRYDWHNIHEDGSYIL
jgi:membrane-associated HD superfamily phosphohydrolase